jgi:hypothetical protein
MLQEAKKTSGMLSDTFANTRGLMTSDDAYLGANRFDAEKFDETEEKVSIKDPTEKVFGKSTDDVDYVDAIRRGEVGTKFVEKPKIGDDLFKPGPAFDDKGTPFARPDRGTVDQMAADAANRQEMISGATADDAAANTLGISSDPSALSTQAQQNVGGTDLEADTGAIARNDIKAKKTFQESVKTGLKETGAAVVDFIKSGGVTGAIVKGLIGQPETMADRHAKGYFNIRGGTTDAQRIAGNPATDLYAGFNRVSRGGNLEKAGKKRIETRSKTLEKRGVNDKAYADANGLKYDPKGVSSNFHRTTKDFEKQQSNYIASKQKATQGPAGGANYGGQNDPSGGNTKIVCTMMNESYGFGSFRNKIWMKFHKDLSPEYQKGYHRLFLPLIRIAKTNKIIKSILEHIAVHSTIDMRQSMRGKKHLLGRVYRKILLPICYWAGKK